MEISVEGDFLDVTPSAGFFSYFLDFCDCLDFGFAVGGLDGNKRGNALRINTGQKSDEHAEMKE